jgi:K+-sensing histidine kinase KdpD
MPRARRCDDRCPRAAAPARRARAQVGAALARAAEIIGQHAVEVECDEGLLASVNPKAISQVIFSLVENAAKYSPPTSPIRVVVSTPNEDTLRIAVEDEGPGIPSKLREQVFEKFFRQAAEPGDAASGLGLGLAIARGIVEAHGSHLSVQSELGGGTVFSFVIR